MFYGAESWPVSAQMNQLINFFAASAYCIMTGVKRLGKVCNTIVSPGMSLYAHYMIDNFASLVTCSKTHTLHMPVPMRYSSQLTAQRECGHPRLNYVDYIERLTGTKIDELVEVSQDREVWRELVDVDAVVVWVRVRVDLQPPD